MTRIDWTMMRSAQDAADQMREAARDAIRIRRDQAIGSGITLDGMALQTDETSQTRIMGAALSAMLDPGYSVRWKTASGEFVTMTAAQVLATAQAVRAHVQACFDREAVLLATLDAGDPYDPDTGWPG